LRQQIGKASRPSFCCARDIAAADAQEGERGWNSRDDQQGDGNGRAPAPPVEGVARALRSLDRSSDIGFRLHDIHRPLSDRESDVRSNAAEPADPFWGRCLFQRCRRSRSKGIRNQDIGARSERTLQSSRANLWTGQMMKTFGVVTLVSVVAVAAAPAPPAREPVSFSTMKSTQEFADCFAKIQDRHAVPWWFVSKESGGTFSNAGASSVGRPYLLLINDRAGRREILLQNAGSMGPEAKAVTQCI